MERIVLRAFADQAKATHDLERLRQSLPGDRFSIVVSLTSDPTPYLIVHDVMDEASPEDKRRREIDLRAPKARARTAKVKN